MLNNTLIVIAAGLSSRMNGMPKHLCKINDKFNIVNTIEKTTNYFDNIYVVLNNKLSDEFKNITEKCLENFNNVKIIYINSGRGDADAILKTIKYLEDNNLYDINSEYIYCWGDAYFKSSKPFKEMLPYNANYFETPLFVGVSVDEDPYAWFDVVDNKIVFSYFKRTHGNNLFGVHDQCIFKTNNKIFKCLLLTYAKYLGFDGENYTNSDNNEMGLLNFITWLANTYDTLCDDYYAHTIYVTKNNVISFNTKEELENLNLMLKNESCSN